MHQKFTHIYMNIGADYKQWLANKARAIAKQTGRRKSMTDVVLDILEKERKKELAEENIAERDEYRTL